MTQLTVHQVKPLVSDGRFFKCVFRKRTNGEMRTILCRTGVRKGLAGGQLAFNPDQYGLLGVYDVRKKAYRFISLDDIKELHHHGQGHFF